MTELIKKIELSRLVGVSSAAVSQAIRAGKLDGAINGSLVDIDHPVAIDWIKNAKKRSKGYKNGKGKPGIKPGEKKKKHVSYKDKDDDNLPRQTGQDIEERVNELPTDLRLLVDKSLRELIELFGTAQIMDGWLKNTLTLDKIYKQRIENAQKEGTLISRDVVLRGVVQPIDTAFQKLMTDFARQVARKVGPMAMAGRASEEIEMAVRDQMSDHLVKVKTSIEQSMDIKWEDIG
jgi:hypothetical protein